MNDLTHIYITIPDVRTQTAAGTRVAIIKSIRRISGLGLKEAKDLSEIPGRHRLALLGQEMMEAKRAGLLFENVSILSKELVTYGVEVGPVAATIIEELRQLGIKSLEAQEDQLASDIMQLVLAEKLRRGC